MTRTQSFVYVVLLWLAGASLRITVLAVPPIVPLLHVDLHLSETAIGVLSSLPPLLFAAAAVPGSLFVARLGAMPTLVTGLFVSALAGAARGAVLDVSVLYGATIAMSLGVAIMQPALPQLVRYWLPQRVGFGTALYTNGMLVGETMSVALTIPVVLPALGGSWRWNLVVWSLPVLATAILAAGMLRSPSLTLGPVSRATAAAAGQRWWPDWTDPQLWKLGLMLGSVNSVYFASNAFLPDYLTQTGQSELISATLTAINLGQVPGSLAMLGLAGRLAGHRTTYVTTALLTFASLLGMTLLTGVWVVVSAALVGMITAVALVLAFALPILLSPPDDVHRMSAGMIAIGYSCAMITPTLGGFLWDASGIPFAAFAPMMVWPLVTIGLAHVIAFQAKPPQRAAESIPAPR
ncbi:MAG TPA: MFS transporter [Alphaproteobacteria bacterium]|nr:MFS transporter [Alphaproteobacteria bacterium]